MIHTETNEEQNSKMNKARDQSLKKKHIDSMMCVVLYVGIEDRLFLLQI